MKVRFAIFAFLHSILFISLVTTGFTITLGVVEFRVHLENYRRDSVVYVDLDGSPKTTKVSGERVMGATVVDFEK